MVRPAGTWVKYALMAVVALAALAAGILVQLERSRLEPPGGPGAALALTRLELPDLQGKRLTLQQWRGKVMVINFWATWCPPCREEMPSLDRLQKALGGPGFEVVALSIDAEGAKAVQAFYKEIGIGALAVYVDPGMRATSQLSTPGVPTTLLIDARGRELGRHAGPAQWDDAEVVRAISRYVAR